MRQDLLSVVVGICVWSPPPEAPIDRHSNRGPSHFSLGAGGYLVFLVLEALRGKKVNENLEKGIMASGLVLLMTLGVVLIVRDTLSLAGIAL